MCRQLHCLPKTVSISLPNHEERFIFMLSGQRLGSAPALQGQQGRICGAADSLGGRAEPSGNIYLTIPDLMVEPFFPFSLPLKSGPAGVSPGYRTSTDALKPEGSHRMRILVPFHEKQSRRLQCPEGSWLSVCGKYLGLSFSDVGL